MFSDMIQRARERSRQRIDDAFVAFSGGESARSEKRSPRCLTLDTLNSQPVKDTIRLPFENEAFDWVACHDLLETCVSFERQVRLLRELLRIARKGIFVSTVNRWHPLSGWLRPPPHEGLLDALRIKTMVDVLPGHLPWQLGHVRVMGLKSHYFLMIWKDRRHMQASVSDERRIVEPTGGRNPASDEAKEVIQRFPKLQTIDIDRMAPQMKHTAALFQMIKQPVQPHQPVVFRQHRA